MQAPTLMHMHTHKHTPYHTPNEANPMGGQCSLHYCVLVWKPVLHSFNCLYEMYFLLRFNFF